MKYIIIGLGNYGHVLAEEFSALGHEVIGADISESRVDSIKDKVATAFVIDATDEQSLSVLPLNSVSLIRSVVGLVSIPSKVFNLRLLALPAITRIK